MQSQAKKRKQRRRQAKDIAARAVEEQVWLQFYNLVHGQPRVSCRVSKSKTKVEGVLEAVEILTRRVKIDGAWYAASKFDRITSQ